MESHDYRNGVALAILVREVKEAKLNPKIDLYLQVGCGRCPLGNTPQCKVHRWTEELALLRSILVATPLIEELKWSVPCYTFDSHNVVILSALKDYCTVGFFKGVLLSDPEQVLEKPGDNSQSSRLIRYTSVSQIRSHGNLIPRYVKEAIEIERRGLKVEMKAKSELVLPDELLKIFQDRPDVEQAFQSLTPGRQRGYVLFFCGAKQTKTRESRIQKSIPDILEGRGIHD